MSVESSATGSQRWWWIGGGVAALVVVVVLVLTLGGGDEPDARPTAMTTSATPDASASPTASAPASATTAPTGASGTASPLPDAAPSGDPQDVPVPPLGAEEPVTGRGDEPVATDGIEVRVASVAATTTEAKGPGDVVGPGILVTLELTNQGRAALDTTGVAVAAFGGAEGVPLSPVDSDGRNDHLSGDLAPGASATGVYVFMSPDEGDALALQVLLGATFSPVVLQGVQIS